MSDYFIHESSYVDDGAKIGKGTKIWHFSHISGTASIGEDCKFGQNTFVADGVKIGNNCKIQNNVSIYTGVELEDNVFLGPSCVLTNVTNPRCGSRTAKTNTKKDPHQKWRFSRSQCDHRLWCDSRGVLLHCSRSSLVTKDIRDFAMIAGVPGKIIGWMSREGERLEFDEDTIFQSE